MMNLAKSLGKIHNLYHVIYANYASDWCTKGNPGEQEETTQKEANAIHIYAPRSGQEFSQEDSPYAVITNQLGNAAEERRSLIKLNVNVNPISRRPHTTILNFTYQQDKKRAIWLENTTRNINHITHMMQRVTGTSQGMKGHGLSKIAGNLQVPLTSPEEVTNGKARSYASQTIESEIQNT